MYKPFGEHNRLSYKYFQIFLVVSIYWIVSILTVFVNKALLSGPTLNLEAPVFVTWFQCVFSSLFCFSLSNLSRVFPDAIDFPDGNPFDLHTFKKIFPLSIVFTLMIATNNLCLTYVGVSFYYVGRSLTTVFNVVLTFILLKEKTSWKCVFCCGIIIFGFLLGVDQESLTDAFSWKGTLFGILGSFSLSLYSIYTKKALPLVNNKVWLLSYFNNVYSSILFIPLILINNEMTVIFKHEKVTDPWFWMVMTIGGICGLSIGFLTTLQIKVTSPLTHNISGTAKACAQTVIATHWYNESKSPLWWASNMIVLLSSALYARIKQLEMKSRHKGSTPQKI